MGRMVHIVSGISCLNALWDPYNFLNVKYGKGFYWILAGDTNELRLDPILNLHPSLKSVVTKSTRDASKKILDNIILTRHGSDFRPHSRDGTRRTPRRWQAAARFRRDRALAGQPQGTGGFRDANQM